MAYIDNQLATFKRLIEYSILNGGINGKQAMIRSSQPINLIHNAVKYELIAQGVKESQIFPPFGESKPELKIAGFLKQKDQDVCVVPKNIKKSSSVIDWGPMASENKIDSYGYAYSDHTLVINIRSQMSSLAKNTDTLFERTYAEATNLHMRYHNMVLGEVFLIPAYEYNDESAAQNQVAFKNKPINVEKYISFFDALNGRTLQDDNCMYERCALLVVDFRPDKPTLYRNSMELKEHNIISHNFNIEYATLGFDTFASDLIDIYAQRYDINNIK